MTAKKRKAINSKPLTAPSPVRAALAPESPLSAEVKDGLAAVVAGHNGYIDPAVRAEFADSLDLDAALLAGHEQENRWDYLLGHAPSAAVIGLEPHSAKEDEVSTVIAKRRAALDQLRGHLRPGIQVASWLWVASGKVHFADTEKARRRLDQHGIQFVGGRVQSKHLPRGGEAPEG